MQTKYRLSSLLQTLGPLVESTVGNLETEVLGVRSLERADPQHLSFASDDRNAQTAIEGTAGALVLPHSFRSKRTSWDRPILFARNVGLCQAQLVRVHFSPPRWGPPGVSPQAQISPSARLGKNVRIEAGVVIGENTVVGDEAKIGANSVIREGVRIGARSEIWPLVFVGAGTEIGSDCVIYPHSCLGKDGYGYAHDEKGHHHAIPQIGKVVLEDHVTLGSHCAIDRAAFDETRIGAGTKLDNHVHFAHNCTVGRHSLLTAGFMTAGSSHLGDHVVTGGAVRVTDHVRIASGVQIAGLSGVSKDITEPGAYGGFPLLPMKDYLKNRAALGNLAKIQKNLKLVMKKLGIEGDE